MLFDCSKCIFGMFQSTFGHPTWQIMHTNANPNQFHFLCTHYEHALTRLPWIFMTWLVAGPCNKRKKWVLFCLYTVSLILCVCVMYILQDGTEPVVKDVLPGDSVHSLLSILDIITVSSLSFFHLPCLCPHPIFWPIQIGIRLALSSLKSYT